MQKHYEDKIKIFTAIAGSLSIFSANNAEAQTIVVRDINPDAVIDISNSTYDLDVDNNGTVDFTIKRETQSSYSSSNVFFYFIGTNGVGYANPPSAGGSNTHTFVSQSGEDWYVAKLNAGDITSMTSEYNDNKYTRLFEVNGNVPPALTDDYQWTAGSTGYVGVQFSIGTEIHFGWVELSVASDYSSVTIKKVGYETVADQAIAAGDGSVTTGTTSNANAKVAGNIYAAGSTVYFNNMAEDCNVTVLNATGNEVYKGAVKSGNNDINLSTLTNGVYIVRATSLSGDKRSSEKVFLQK